MEQQNKKWYDNKLAVGLLLFFFFPIGLYALWKSQTIKQGWKIAWTIIIALLVIGAMSDNDKKSTDYASTSENSIDKSNSEPSYIQLGETLSTRYFDVTVNKASINDRVNTGNEFADLNPESGNSYLIMNTTFKNTDNESRMLTDGEVLIIYNGKEYKFDNAETIMLEGWGLLLDQINPLTSKTTNLVYKIPTEIKGPVYYRPGRSSSDDKILVGNIE